MCKLYRQFPFCSFEAFTDLCNLEFLGLDAKEVFMTVKNLERYRSLPHLGVVVVYEADRKYIGWSLCNSKKDSFNKYIGIRQAISRAVPIQHFNFQANAIPHSCMRFIEKVLLKEKIRNQKEKI
jgi:hypothetical protein